MIVCLHLHQSRHNHSRHQKQQQQPLYMMSSKMMSTSPQPATVTGTPAIFTTRLKMFRPHLWHHPQDNHQDSHWQEQTASIYMYSLEVRPHQHRQNQHCCHHHWQNQQQQPTFMCRWTEHTSGAHLRHHHHHHSQHRHHHSHRQKQITSTFVLAHRTATCGRVPMNWSVFLPNQPTAPMPTSDNSDNWYRNWTYRWGKEPE